jgi:hypothetical protein
VALSVTATQAELHIPVTSANPSIVPNTSVALEVEEPLNEQPKARGADALETLSDMSPDTAAPTATLALTDMLPRAEQAAVNTPSVTPLDGIEIVPVIVCTPLLILRVGLQLRSS